MKTTPNVRADLKCNRDSVTAHNSLWFIRSLTVIRHLIESSARDINSMFLYHDMRLSVFRIGNKDNWPKRGTEIPLFEHVILLSKTFSVEITIERTWYFVKVWIHLKVKKTYKKQQMDTVKVILRHCQCSFLTCKKYSR